MRTGFNNRELAEMDRNKRKRLERILSKDLPALPFTFTAEEKQVMEQMGVTEEQWLKVNKPDEYKRRFKAGR